MFKNMVDVRSPKNLPQAPRRTLPNKSPVTDMQRYLKINKIRLFINTTNNVAALIQIKVSNVTPVYLLQQFEQFVKKSVRQAAALSQRVAFYIFIYKSIPAITRYKAGYSHQGKAG